MNFMQSVSFKIVILIISCSAFQNVAASPEGGLPPPSLPWTSLKYKASKYFMTLHADIKLSRISGELASNQLSYAPSACKPLSSSEEYISLSIATEAVSRQVQSDILMKRDSRVIDNSARRNGSAMRQRSYRYCDDSVHLRKRRPKSTEEEGLSWRQWSDIRDERFLMKKPYPEPITEIESIFYLVSIVNSYSPDQTFHIYVYDRPHIMDYQVKVGGVKRISVDYSEFGSSGERHVSGVVDSVSLTVEPRLWLNETHASDKLPGLLGLKGTLQLYVDPDKGVILELSGTVDYLGKVKIRLTELRRTNPP